MFRTDNYCIWTYFFGHLIAALDSNPRSKIKRQRHNNVNPQQLAERWGIGLEQANLTIQNTTQYGIRSALMPLSRRYRGDLFYQLKRLQGNWYTDIYHGRHLSLEGKKYTQIFTNKKNACCFYTPFVEKRGWKRTKAIYRNI